MAELDATSAPDLDSSLAKLFCRAVSCSLYFDLSGLEYVSQFPACGPFLSAAKRMKQAQGNWCWASPSHQVQQVFDVAGLSTILSILQAWRKRSEFHRGRCTVGSCKGGANQAYCSRRDLPVALDENLGVIKSLPVFTLDYALASAMLMELALCGQESIRI